MNEWCLPIFLSSKWCTTAFWNSPPHWGVSWHLYCDNHRNHVGNFVKWGCLQSVDHYFPYSKHLFSYCENGSYTVMTSETISGFLDSPCLPTVGLQHDNFILTSRRWRLNHYSNKSWSFKEEPHKSTENTPSRRPPWVSLGWPNLILYYFF